MKDSHDVTDPYSANFSEMIYELLPFTKTIDRLGVKAARREP
jgi:hypothetical protein